MKQDTKNASMSLALRNIELLAGLPPERLEAIARQCAWRNHEKGQSIISREADDGRVYFLAGGRARVTTYSSAGREVTFRDIEAGAMFGELAAIDEGPRSADVIALDSALTASLAPADFRQLLREEGLLAERVLKRLAGLVRLLTDRVVDLSTHGVPTRIHAELLRLAREAGVANNRARLQPPPKHVDIASRVSTYREQVTREFSALTRAGILAKEKEALLVEDVARLEALIAAAQV
jgi:CRP/FNR family cyclic AMP-dependent transcriptional regulator